jgi:hypothetical protein
VYPDHVAVHEDRAVIYALFNSMGNEEKGTPRCELNARWPAGSGDIYFSEDSCLRDSTGSFLHLNGELIPLPTVSLRSP